VKTWVFVDDDVFYFLGRGVRRGGAEKRGAGEGEREGGSD